MADNLNQKSPKSNDKTKLTNAVNRTTSETMRLGEPEKAVNHPTTLFSSTPKERKKTPAFQITSVTVGPRISNDGGDDSADDLDESHTDDTSDVIDNSRITDIENETPSYSEDTFSKEEVFFNASNASLGTAPVIPTSSQYGLQIVAPEGGGNNQNPAVTCANNINNSGEVHVNSVTDSGNVINIVSSGKQSEADMRDVHSHTARNERFKVVKIESTEPFKRGRWMCMDYLDHSMVNQQQSQTAIIVKSASDVADVNAVQHVGPDSGVVLMDGMDHVPSDHSTTISEQQHQTSHVPAVTNLTAPQSMPANYTASVSPGQTMQQMPIGMTAQTMPMGSEMAPHAQSLSQVPVVGLVQSQPSVGQSLPPQQMQALLQNYQQQGYYASTTHIISQASSMPVQNQPLQTSTAGGLPMQGTLPMTTSQHIVGQTTQYQQQPAPQSFPQQTQQHIQQPPQQMGQTLPGMQGAPTSAPMPQIQVSQPITIPTQPLQVQVSQAVPHQSMSVPMSQPMQAQSQPQPMQVPSQVQTSQPMSVPSQHIPMQGQSQPMQVPQMQAQSQPGQVSQPMQGQSQPVQVSQPMQGQMQAQSQPVQVPHVQPMQTQSQSMQVPQQLQGQSQPVQVSQMQAQSQSVQVTQMQAQSQPVQVTQMQAQSQPLQVNQLQAQSQPVQANQMQAQTQPLQVSQLQAQSQPVQMPQMQAQSQPVQLAQTIPPHSQAQVLQAQSQPVQVPQQIQQPAQVSQLQAQSQSVQMPPHVQQPPSQTTIPQMQPQAQSQSAPVQQMQSQTQTMPATQTLQQQPMTVPVSQVPQAQQPVQQLHVVGVPQPMVTPTSVPGMAFSPVPTGGEAVPEVAGKQEIPAGEVIRGQDDDAQSTEEPESASGSSAVAIDNKIEQAMDLVKSHLMFAVREEVEVLKERIAELMERINQLELENTILKAHATQETLAQLGTTKAPAPQQPAAQPPPPSAGTGSQQQQQQPQAPATQQPPPPVATATTTSTSTTTNGGGAML